MDILCLMGLFPKEYEKEIMRDSIQGVQNAANKLQWGIVNGLDACEDTKVRICNSLYIGSYPRKYKKMIIPTFEFSHREGVKDVNIGFCNLALVKYLSRYIGTKKYVEEWAKESRKEQKVLLVYALTVPFAQIAGDIQKKYPMIKVCVVVPDLPEYMNVGKMKNKRLYSKLKSIEISWIRQSLSEVQYFVLLTDAMKNWFGRKIKYTVVEGIASVTDNNQIADREKTILYAGGIKREYGVIDLAEAFTSIDAADWQLVIYGDGSDLEYLREFAKKDERIKLMGSVPNEVVVDHQRRAALLVNPRKNQEFTKYSFPSKILEYMSSGTPMLAYKLDGMPDEYDSYYYQIPINDDGMVSALRNAMNLSDSERKTLGWRARKFVGKNKSSKVQCQKIMNLLLE